MLLCDMNGYGITGNTLSCNTTNKVFGATESQIWGKTM